MSFWRGRPLNVKFQNFAAKGFMRTPIRVFLSRFAEVGKAEVTKRVRGVQHERMVGLFSPFICSSWSDLIKDFTGALFPRSQ